MKKIQSKTIRKIAITCLSTLTIVNVFCLGFASFITDLPNSQIVGNININMGGVINATLKANNPVASSNVFQNGFENAGTLSKKGSIDINFDLNVDLGAGAKKPSIQFSIEQVDNINEPAYSDFNMLDYLTGISLKTTTNGKTFGPLTKSPSIVNGKKKKLVVFNFSDSCFISNFNKFAADCVLSYQFSYNGDLFAKDIFNPVYYGKPTFNVELISNG